MPLILATSLPYYGLLLLLVSVFVPLATWAIIAGLDILKRRRGLAERREELASDVLKSMRTYDGEAPAVKKSLRYLPDTMPAEPASADRPKNPWLMVLLHPQQIIRQIVAFDPQLHVPLLSCLYGISALLEGFLTRPNWQISYATLPLIVLLGGPVFGLISVALVSWVVRIAATYFGGKASEHETQAAFVWSLLPQIYLLPLTFTSASEVASATGAAADNSARWLLLITLVAMIVARIWSFVLWLNTLAEVNQFSRWKAFAALVVSSAIAFVIGVLFALPFVITYFVLGLSPLMFAVALVISVVAGLMYLKLARA